jgi:hypothetical protein
MGLRPEHTVDLHALLEAVVIPVEHCRDSGDFLGKQAKVKFRVALLDHAPQEPWCVDLARRLVHGASISADLLLMAGHALVLGDKALAQFKVSPAKKGWLLSQRWQTGQEQTCQENSDRMFHDNLQFEK